ncbi:hypothetical protein KPL76_13795 [Subtercola sp. PAMC28395]|uniref:hypothetical protein n=1 Tax=Subtercola sp. PAMC28395 TaxID=2846775 RepID=UPI001C0CCD4F|nr:hypothetical protein [Subtercola sp. PAMC28395]QWT23739.1 hypothetical protein KPL76_13795 [Subtercola sp. PAMC28395]
MMSLGVVSAWVVFAYLGLVSVPLGVSDFRGCRLPNALVLPGYLLLALALVGRAQWQPP